MIGAIPAALLLREEAPVQQVYQLWQHLITGEVYAVRLECCEDDERPRITGVCGPTDPHCLPAESAFPDEFYQGGVYVRDLVARRDEFAVLPVRSHAERR